MLWPSGVLPKPEIGAWSRAISSVSSRSESAVRRARDGTYSQFEVQRGLGITQMIRWFEECDDGWRAIEPLPPPTEGDF